MRPGIVGASVGAVTVAAVTGGGRVESVAVTGVIGVGSVELDVALTITTKI